MESDETPSSKIDGNAEGDYEKNDRKEDDVEGDDGEQKNEGEIHESKRKYQSIEEEIRNLNMHPPPPDMGDLHPRPPDADARDPTREERNSNFVDNSKVDAILSNEVIYLC